jgi:hypothetical protein
MDFLFELAAPVMIRDLDISCGIRRTCLCCSIRIQRDKSSNLSSEQIETRRVYELEAWRRLPTTSSILLPSVVVARTRRSISISIDLRKQWEVDAPVFKELGRKLESCLVWSLLVFPEWTQATRHGELRARRELRPKEPVATSVILTRNRGNNRRTNKKPYFLYY